MLTQIAKRQSIRLYQDKEIPDAVLEEILQAAFRAPTSKNRQDWNFFLITDEKILRDISVFPSYVGFKTCKAAIIVLSDTSFCQDDASYSFIDAGAACQNILLEGMNQGIASCWCAIAPHKEKEEFFRDYFHLEEALLPIAAISLGYAAQERPYEERFDLEKVRYYR